MRKEKLVFDNRPIARLLLVTIVALMLSGLYLYKASSKEFILTVQGVSNEPLLVYGEKYPQNFKNDDVFRYSPIPYTYSHKSLMNYLWENPAQAEMKYKSWLFLLVTLSVISFYFLFFHFSGKFVLSLALSLATVVGYYEHWWLFSFIGITGYDSLVGRANYTALIPLYLLLFLNTLRLSSSPIWFFFLLGVGVNLYPSISILSAAIFYAVMVIQKRTDMKLAGYLYPVLAFLLASIPFIYFSYSDIAAFKQAHLSDPRHYQFLDHMNAVLKGSASQYKELEWSRLFNHPQGNFTGLIRHFFLYPPFLILLGFVTMAGLWCESQEKGPKNSNEVRILIQLFWGAIFLLLIGWLMKGLNIELATKLPPHYIGNFLIVVGYAVIASQFKNVSTTEVSFRQSWAWLAAIIFALISVAGYYYSATNSIFSDAAYWIVLNAIFIAMLLKKYGRIPSTYLLVMIILAIASGFSYSYHEIATPMVPYKYFSRALPVVFSLVFVALLIVSLRQARKNLSAYALLLVMPFSWALPVRIYDNVAALLNNNGANEMHRSLSDFNKMAEWVGHNTPVDSRFMINNSSGDLGLVSVFKYLAVRPTPLIAGGDYYFYGDLGRRYGARNADAYVNALRANDDNAILQLSSEIGFEYFIVNALDSAYVSNGFKKVYDGNYFDVYKIKDK